jgi:hypothetical protein
MESLSSNTVHTVMDLAVSVHAQEYGLVEIRTIGPLFATPGTAFRIVFFWQIARACHRLSWHHSC